jgi:hypothetical protein
VAGVRAKTLAIAAIFHASGLGSRDKILQLLAPIELSETFAIRKYSPGQNNKKRPLCRDDTPPRKSPAEGLFSFPRFPASRFPAPMTLRHGL